LRGANIVQKKELSRRSAMLLPIPFLLVTGRANAAPPTDGGLQDILKRGELIVAVQTQGPPVSFVDNRGERVGFAVDIAKAMAADMGVRLQMPDYDFRGLIPAIMSGKVDFVAADLTPTPQRALQLTFTDYTFTDPIILYAKADRNLGPALSLDRAGVSIGVVQGSSNRRLLERRFPHAMIREFAGGGPALAQALSADRVDAVINTRSSALANIAALGDGYRILDGDLGEAPEGFAVLPEKYHLIAWLNIWIKLARQDGRLAQWAHYWRESSDWRKDHA